MRLTRAIRVKLLNGEAPAITGTGKPPVEKGYSFQLSPKVELTVLRVDTKRSVKGEEWSLHYLLVDRRDPKRLLRRTPPVSHPSRKDFDGYGYPLPVSASDASDTSSYTAGGSVVADAGEAVPRAVQDKLTADAKMHGCQEHAARRRRYEQQAVVLRLAHQLERAEALGIHPGRDLARLDAAVAKLERTNDRAQQQRRAA